LKDNYLILKYKRGMAKGIKVALLILLIFVSIVIIWFGMKAILNSGSQNGFLDRYNSDLRILQVQMVDYEDVSIKVKKTSYDDGIKGVNFVVYDGEGNEMATYISYIEELEQNSYEVVLSVENTSRIEKVTIAPILISKSGEEIVGSFQDQYKVTGPVTVFNPPFVDTGYADNEVKYCTYASDCKDHDPCTIGACSGGECSYPRIPGCEFCASDLDCKDNNSCTNDLCTEDRCSYPVIEGCQSCAYAFQCEDEDPCTEDVCIDNGCSYTPVLNCTACILDSQCEDNDSCTTNTCYNNKCSYNKIANCTSCTLDSECEDNDSCTTNSCIDEGCSFIKTSGCTSCTSATQCNDYNLCTTDSCSSGLCNYSAITNCITCNSNIQCNDNNACTTDSCLSGTCKYIIKSNCKICTQPYQCEDNNSCTDNLCLNGACSNPKIEDCTSCTSVYHCDDNNPCTENKCLNNLCSYTPILNCGSNNSCTSASQCNDNDACTTDACTGGRCVNTQIINCGSNSSSCVYDSNCPPDLSSCQPIKCINHICVLSPITSCINNDFCCPNGCTYTNDNNCAQCTSVSQCKDNNNCTTDACTSGKCVYTNLTNCKTCTSVTQCNDNVACTTDSCSNGVCSNNAISGCKSCTSASQCNDNVACTTDSCTSGKCVYTSITNCINNDGCCPTNTGCTNLNDNNCAASCGNGVIEATEKCDGTNLGGATCAGVAGSGYTGTLKCSSSCTFNTSACIATCACNINDDNICTTDICNNGICQHIPINGCCTSSSQCNDNIACTTNICSSSNRCSYPAITACAHNDGCCPSGANCNALNDNNCAAVCGNGYREGSEGCDDGDKTGGDGCSSTCTVESGWSCNTATPNVCTQGCTPSCSGRECGQNTCNTGSCGSCSNAHGTNTCSSAGLCQPVCSSGYDDCDGITTNGCETSLTTTSNCGWCGNSCSSGESCSGGSCVSSCTSQSYSSCYNGDVYWYNSCGTREGVRTYCDYVCSGNNCISAPSTGGFIINHLNTDITQIPSTCIEKAKALTFQYAHRSDGANILQGLNYVYNQNNAFRSAYQIDSLPSQTSPIRLRIMDGNPPESDYSYPENYWNSADGRAATEYNWASGNFDASMWSWCSEFNQGYLASDLANSYLNTMNSMEADYPSIEFVYMTSYGDYRDSNIAAANQIIRDFAVNNDKILYDFEDIGRCDPDGNCYSSATRDCSWCSSWCSSHSSYCTNLPSTCDHTHGLLCAQRAKAFWWMMARLAGWDGIAGHEC
jgi:hypothetical protein